MALENSSDQSDKPLTDNSSVQEGVDSSAPDPSAAKSSRSYSLSVLENGNDSKPIVLSMPEGVAIELRDPPERESKSARWGEFLKDAGPVFTGLFSLIVSFLVFYYGHQINRRQTEINEKQTELKQKELEVAQADLRVKQAELLAKQADLRQKVFAELNQPEETSQTLAAIRLAEYGEEILDPIRMALGVEQEKIQAGAVKVVFHIFRSETVPREIVVAKLMEFIGSGNPHLRVGALDCLIEICDELTGDQRQHAVAFLKSRLGPRAEDCGSEDERVLLEVTKFFGDCPSSDSVEFLLGVLHNCSYEDPRSQAVLNLCKVVIGLPVETRDAVIANLEALLESRTISGDLNLDIENTIKKIRKASCL
jgi:hypothetical protein